MRIVIQPSALRDLREGFRFYEKQENGVGSYFLDSLFSDVDSLQLYAGIHPVHFGRFHRLLSKRFPYAVYYQMDADAAPRCGTPAMPSWKATGAARRHWPST